MDLERIKQNFRLRSGRSRKTKEPKDTIQSRKEVVANGTVPTPPKPQTASSTQPASANTKQKVESKPTAGSHEREAEEGEQSRAPADPATQLEDEPDIRYGRSGIDQKPHLKTASDSDKRMTEQDNKFSSDTDGEDFDLRPPAPKPKPPNIETISELLFSSGHLNTILHQPQSVAKFTAFLNKYQPEYQPLILRYLETQKAITAIAYANAVAEGANDDADQHSSAVEAKLPGVAATLDKAFEEASNASFNALVGTALPMYVTYQLVKLVTECLVNEISGRQTALMRNLVGGLSEVFCLTDPNQDDNPIIYASEEFYRLTGYGSEDVIGRNCRFLQGSKTIKQSPRRIKESTQKGEGICEALLNYRRDGRPFINLLLIAPLHDDKGKVKYNIGAQVDVSGLVEGGRGLDDFERFLYIRQMDKKQQSSKKTADSQRNKKALDKLKELSEMFDLEESAVVQESSSRASSMTRDEDTRSGSSARPTPTRRVFVDSDEEEGEKDDEDSKQEQEAWSLGQSGSSGKLPGVYDTYMLIRPAPSLRIIFQSPKLQKLGNAVRSPFLAHVAAPGITLAGLRESFSTGTPVTAKIDFMAKAGESRNGTKTDGDTKPKDGARGRTCWISATPLLGGDDKVGVWMVVMVEKAKERKSAKIAEVEAKMAQKKDKKKPDHIDMPKQSSPRGRDATPAPKEEMPIKPKRLDDPATNDAGENDQALDPESKPDQADTNGSGSQAQVNHVQNDGETPDDESEHFVRSNTPSKQAESNSNGRVVIEPDSEDDEAPVQDSVDDVQDDTTLPSSSVDRKYTPPPDIPASMENQTPPPQTPSVRADDATPRRNSFAQTKEEENGDEEEEDDSNETPTRPSNRMASSQILSMDYLTHPGSRRRQADDIGREKGDNWADLDCLRSPYSVD